MLPKILVAAGNFAVTRAVQEAIDGRNMNVKGAYTHRDTLYMLQQQRYNIVIVDAAMFDRHTDEFTLAALERLKNPLPRIAVALNPESERRARELGAEVLTTLDRMPLRTTIETILGKTMPNRSMGTTNLVSRKRVDEMQTLMQLARSLTETLDSEEVLNRVVIAARELTNADEGMILLPEENADGQVELILRAKVGIDIEPASNFRIRMDDSIAGEVYRSGQATMEGRRGPLKVKTQHLVNSLLYVPIVLQSRVIGVLGVNNRSKEDVFDLHQRDLLVSLASFAAVALENARMHDERLQRARELELLVNASQVMNDTLEIHDTLTNITEQICTILDASSVEFYQWDAAERSLTRRAEHDQALWRPFKGPVEQISAAQLMTLMDTNSLTTQGEGTSTHWLAIISEDRLQGVLRATYPKENAPTLDSAVAEQVRTEAMAAMAELLNTTENTRAKRHRDVRDRLLGITDTLDATVIEILLASEQTSALYLLARIGEAYWTDVPLQTLDLETHPLVRQAVDTQQVTVCQPGSSEFCMCMPVTRRDRLMAVVIIHDHDGQRTMNAREIEMARALTGQAASALDNARLHADLQRSHEELKATQMKLVENVRYYAMGELAAIVAHQINNPLTTIIVDSELLMLTESPDARQYKSYAAINNAGKRASMVAKRLLAMVRPADENAEPEMIDVVDTIHGVLHIVGTHIERRNVTLRLRLPPEGAQVFPPVLAIRGQLDDVWLNLITNAYEAMSQQTNAQLGVEADYDSAKKSIVVRVWDNGPGFSEETGQNIFSPFYTTKTYGTGLGLHICRKVIEQVKGTIEFESFIGKGTRFTVTLPIAPELQTAQESEDA
jgi:signal transduction histidine kinase